MNFLVGEFVLSGGETVMIHWSDGSVSRAIYQDTFGYNHLFSIPQNDGTEKTVRLSNHFMHLKGITLTRPEDGKTL